MPRTTSKSTKTTKRAKNTASAKKTARGATKAESGRVHLYAAMSLDGYLATSDGGVAWLDPYADAREGFKPFIRTIGSAIMGRTTYDKAVADGYADFGSMPSYVVTHRPLDNGSVIPYRGDLRELVTLARERHPKDIWLMGGGELTKSFQELDLIDIWSIAFIPTLLGKGLPMFPPAVFAERRLELIRTHKYPSGVVELQYERRAGKGRSS